MTEEQLNQIIAQGEGLKIEFKEGRDFVPKSIYETAVSFSNTDGGTILLGVDDDGNITGVDPAASFKIQKNLVSTLNSRDCVNPPLYVQPSVVNHSNGIVLAIQIPASSQVHDHAGKIYIREVDSDIDITENQEIIGNLYLRKKEIFTESQIYPGLGFDDFDKRLFDRARQLISNYRSDHPWLLESNEQMLKDSTLWRKDFKANQEGYTLAAALIFGKDVTIQSILPAYKVEAMVRIKNKDRWDDRITLRTNLIDTYLKLKEFINKHLPENFYLEGDQRIDLRDKIFREVIGNVIVHREYTNALTTELIITEMEVTITNPNKPHFRGAIDPKGFNPFPKNPNIRKFFTAFGWTDEIGSGIRNTNKYLPLYIPNAKPLFIENDTFKTYLPLQFSSLGTFATAFQRWLELPEETWSHLQTGLANIALPAHLSQVTFEELLLHLVPSWHEKGTQLALLGWDENQVISRGEIEKVPSGLEKGTQLLRRKNWYLISILSVVTEPARMSELLDWMNYKNAKKFRDNYIKPLRETGMIALTNPDKPTSPDNRYVITEIGKAFLSGM
jgi:ATP-dependent DNA helicase RecG